MSFGAGPVKFPPSTHAALDLRPGQVRVVPGGSATISVEDDNTLGTSVPATISWTASTPAGSSRLSVKPSSGTLTAPAGGTARATVTISAASGMTA